MALPLGADVARAQAGGITAEKVAHARQVSLDTIRTQMRTMLWRSNAVSLCGLERLVGLVSA